jgi:hypothetical protein
VSKRFHMERVEGSYFIQAKIRAAPVPDKDARGRITGLI